MRSATTTSPTTGSAKHPPDAAPEARADLAELEGDDDARREALEEAARLHRSCGDEVIAKLVEGRLAEAG